MKKLILSGIFALSAGFAFSATVTIVNSGFLFSPDNVTINVGDTIIFQLENAHNTLEVSEATWNVGGITPLPGFSTPFGGGQVTGLTAGLHFYVCEPHAAFGMKGQITVAPASGINSFELNSDKINIYPNPTNGNFTLEFMGSATNTGSGTGIDEQTSMEIFNLLGEKVYDLQGYITISLNEIDFSGYSDGIYFVRISERKKIYTQKFIKQ